jgi:hypothetical protein
MFQPQQQHDETTRSPATPDVPADAEGAIDPWESISATEEPATAPPAALVDLDEPPDPDQQALTDAAANAAAVELAMLAAEPAPAGAMPVDIQHPRSGGGAFTLPMLCGGIALIAACLLIPQVDANRRLVYERMKLQNDLEAVDRQVEVNDQFLQMVANDPNLAERLAQRQMKIIRKGTEVLNLKSGPGDEMSPYQLTAVPVPPDLPPYQPRGGKLAQLCYNPKSRLYLMGVGLLAVAVGLVMGFGPAPKD